MLFFKLALSPHLAFLSPRHHPIERPTFGHTSTGILMPQSLGEPNRALSGEVASGTYYEEHL